PHRTLRRAVRASWHARRPCGTTRCRRLPRFRRRGAIRVRSLLTLPDELSWPGSGVVPGSDDGRAVDVDVLEPDGGLRRLLERRGGVERQVVEDDQVGTVPAGDTAGDSGPGGRCGGQTPDGFADRRTVLAQPPVAGGERAPGAGVGGGAVMRSVQRCAVGGDADPGGGERQ